MTPATVNNDIILMKENIHWCTALCNVAYVDVKRLKHINAITIVYIRTVQIGKFT